MAYRVRASEMASAPSGRLRWGDLQSEIASSFTDALTPKPADLFIASSSQRSGRDASPSELATKRLRAATPSVLNSPITPSFTRPPRSRWMIPFWPPGQTTGLTNPRPSLLATIPAPASSRGSGRIRTGPA
jgi:hypothetical protein